MTLSLIAKTFPHKHIHHIICTLIIFRELRGEKCGLGPLTGVTNFLLRTRKLDFSAMSDPELRIHNAKIYAELDKIPEVILWLLSWETTPQFLGPGVSSTPEDCPL